MPVLLRRLWHVPSHCSRSFSHVATLARPKRCVSVSPATMTFAGIAFGVAGSLGGGCHRGQCAVVGDKDTGALGPGGGKELHLILYERQSHGEWAARRQPRVKPTKGDGIEERWWSPARQGAVWYLGKAYHFVL